MSQLRMVTNPKYFNCKSRARAKMNASRLILDYGFSWISRSPNSGFGSTHWRCGIFRTTAEASQRQFGSFFHVQGHKVSEGGLCKSPSFFRDVLLERFPRLHLSGLSLSPSLGSCWSSHDAIGMDSSRLKTLPPFSPLLFCGVRHLLPSEEPLLYSDLH